MASKTKDRAKKKLKAWVKKYGSKKLRDFVTKYNFDNSRHEIIEALIINLEKQFPTGLTLFSPYSSNVKQINTREGQQIIKKLKQILHKNEYIIKYDIGEESIDSQKYIWIYFVFIDGSIGIRCYKF